MWHWAEDAKAIQKVKEKLMKIILALAFGAIIGNTYAQLISFSKDGKLGVNFGGYHAGVGAGPGGLFAEAGTPLGQNAKAGLGGTASDKESQGGLYAEANAGGGIGARAGLAGRTDVEGSQGAAFAHSSAGGKQAGAGLGGVSNAEGSTGYKFTSNTNTKVVVEKELPPPPPAIVKHKKVHVEYEVPKEKKPEYNAIDYANVNPLAAEEPHPEPPKEEVRPVVVYRKHKRPHVYKTYVSKPVEERIDVQPQPPVNFGGDVVYTKTIQSNRSPTFFADIFNIPISTLNAVSKFLGTAASTNINVEKKVHASADNAANGGDVSKSATVQSSVSVKSDTPASSLLDGVFSIPINTLQAVNKFLENNVPARKEVVVTASGDGAVKVVPFRGGRAARHRNLRRVHAVVSEKDSSR